jgi:ATP-binding cassette subfamily F protein 3
VRSGEDVITLENVLKSYDGNVVYRDLNLTLTRGDRVALVGANGAGKTTLLKILAGVLPIEGGERKLGHNVTTAYYAQYQLELLQPENTLLDELRRVAPDEPEQRLRGLLGAFLFSGDDAYKKVSVLSGGEKSRLAIAKILARTANLLLMDEPTNHLDIDSREMLTDALEAYHGTLCFITHDRTLIRQIANKVIEIRGGVPRVYSGNYDEYLSWKEAAGNGDPQRQGIRSIRDTSPRDILRQRKVAEGQLRNSYYQASSPIKKRISEIEAELSELETQFRELENYFSNPKTYGDAAEIIAVTRKHRELKETIRLITGEWERLSSEAERKRLEYEEAKQNLDSESAR